MNRKTINAVIVIGIISVISILIVQISWINTTTKIQEQSIEIQRKQDSLNQIHFNEQTNIALRNVLDEISTQKRDSSDLYGAVHQIKSNYFSVDINEELHPFYLENLLKREFYEQHILHNFQYGIYDCFTDSIVFGNLIKYDEITHFESIEDSTLTHTSEDMQWSKDGHYFTVFFPDIQQKTIFEQSANPYIYLFIVVVFVLIFFGYSVSVILKQKKLSDVKTDFINNMTHELKTPISTIGLSSEMLMNTGNLNDISRVQNYAGIIYKENKRLEQQVERVLNIAKLDNKELKLTKEVVDIHELLTDLKENFESTLFEQKNGSITLDLSAKNTMLRCDIVHITNVLYNLVDNAIKYCDKNPEITISTQLKNNYFVLNIRDNGIGISKDAQKQIFDKFYRVPTGNLHNVKGFGIGLYYVKTIIEEHDGTIQVQSKLNNGTTFTIKLPT